MVEAQTVYPTLPHYARTSTPPTKSSEDMLVHDSEAYKYAHEIIDDTLKCMQHPNPRSLQEVSELLDRLGLSDYEPCSESSTVQSQSFHDRVQEVVEQIKPYIFGRTPMCRALKDAKAAFDKIIGDLKVLFILSDGQSTDGDPRSIAQALRDSGVTVVTCFLTADHISNPKCLLDPFSKFQDQAGKQALFDMSSVVHNTEKPVCYLGDFDWKLPLSGESSLFIQANSLETVNQFCKVVVSQMTDRSFDSIVHVLEKAPLATYINQTNADFKPKSQEGGTCYANAIAAVLHLAMHRIVEREGGIPDFYEIRKRIIDEYGYEGANTEKVLKKVCPEYRLQFHKVDETGARHAINRRRPVVAKFWLYDEQWDKFSAFYKTTPKKVLQECHLSSMFTNIINFVVLLYLSKNKPLSQQ